MAIESLSDFGTNQPGQPPTSQAGSGKTRRGKGSRTISAQTFPPGNDLSNDFRTGTTIELVARSGESSNFFMSKPGKGSAFVRHQAERRSKAQR